MTTVPDRIVTVSTIRDTVPNVGWFVERTLASGVDHMVIFLDQKQPELHAAFGRHPCVTVVPTARAWWHGQRPGKVEDRQFVNATLTNAVLTMVPSVRWLFHIDCDETLDFDRDALLACTDRVVRFATREVVALPRTRPPEEILFKKMPTQADLLALAGLGAIASPRLEDYLRGHAAGKTGVRPDLGLRIGVHVAYDATGEKIEAEAAPSSHLLHYDSWSMADFADRWRDYTPKKARRTNHRDRRKKVGLAASAIVNHPTLRERARRKYLGVLFDKHVRDDVAALRTLDLLTPHPALDREPHPLGGHDLAVMGALFAALRAVDKTPFGPGAEPGALAGTLEAVAPELGDRALSDRLRQVVAAHRQGEENVSP